LHEQAILEGRKFESSFGKEASMRSLILAVAFVLAIGSTAYGGWYAGPVVGYTTYYAPAPVYAYPAPVPYVTYAPVVAPVVAPAPVWVARPVVVGPAGKVYVPGRPVRNAVRAVLP
jgi:hypothetical protein